MCFVLGIVVWRREAQNRNLSCLFWALFVMKKRTVIKYVTKQHNFAHLRNGVAQRWATTQRGGWRVSSYLLFSVHLLVCA